MKSIKKILEIDKTFKEDDLSVEEHKSIFENQKEFYKEKIKSEIKKNLLQEYISAVKESSSLLAKILSIEDMEDQIPNDSILFEDLGKFNKIYNEKKEKPSEILDKLTQIDGASSEKNIPHQDLELFFKTEKDKFKEHIKETIEKEKASQIPTNQESDKDQDQLKNLMTNLDELYVEFVPAYAKVNAIKENEDYLPNDSPLREELHSLDKNFSELKEKIDQICQNIKQLKNDFDEDVHFEKNMMESFVKKIIFLWKK